MKALILCGGFGNNLKPLTFSKPKMLVEFGDKPIIEHQIEAQTKVGIQEIILAISSKPDSLVQYMKTVQKKYGVHIIYSQEQEPLGTAGPQKLAESKICAENTDNLFFVLNADIICDFPFEKLQQFHKWHSADATMQLTMVEDPSKFGVVVTNEEGRAVQFIEKSEDFISNKINAGIYLLNTSLLKKIKLKPTSLEREVFPQVAREGQLYTLQSEGFWMDVSSPKDYQTGTNLYLDNLREENSDKLSSNKNVVGNVIIHPTAKVNERSIIGPNVVIGENCMIEEGSRIKNTTLQSGTKIKANTWVSNTIIGWKSVIGKWVRIEGTSVIAEDVIVADELYINSSMVLPHKFLKESLPIKDTVFM